MRVVLALALPITALSLTSGQQPEADKGKLTAERARVLQATQHGKPTPKKQADAVVEEFQARLASLIKTHGSEAHVEVIELLRSIAVMQHHYEQYPEARKTRQRLLEAEKALLGNGHWRVADDSWRLKNLDIEEQLPDSRRPVWRSLVESIYRDDPPETQSDVLLLPNAEWLLKHFASEGGEPHPGVAIALVFAGRGNLQTNPAKGEGQLQEALQIFRATLGQQHPLTAATLASLGRSNSRAGNDLQAELQLRQVVEIYQSIPGLSAKRIAAYFDLCRFYLERRRPDQAESVLLAMPEVGPDDSQIGSLLRSTSGDLGVQFLEMGVLAKAELYCKRALKRPEDRTDPSDLNRLALVYLQMGKPEQAEPHLLEALKMAQRSWGERSVELVAPLQNLAMLYEQMGNDSNAERDYRRAVEMSRWSSVEGKHFLASSLTKIGQFYWKTNRPPRARQCLQEAIEIYRKFSPNARHPDLASCLYLYGDVLEQQGELAEAHSHRLDSLEITLENLAAASEAYPPLGKQRVDHRPALENAVATRGQTPAYYDAVLRLRSSDAWPKWFRHTLADATDNLQPAIAELRQTQSKLVSRAGPASPYDRADWGSPLSEMGQLQQQLSRQQKSLQYRWKTFAAYQNRKRPTGAELQKLLPADAALIEYLQYREKLCAYVITPRAITRVELGDLRPIGGAVDQFRKQIRGDPPAAFNDPAGPRFFLRKALIEPLSPHLNGVKTLVISPDSALSRLPFAALPGDDAKKMLIEERGIAIIPVPSMLLDLLTPHPPKENPSLLAVGDVDFGDVRANSGSEGPWAGLPATARELEQVAAQFRAAHPQGGVTTLKKSLASKQLLGQAIPRHSLLHVASHGFFAAEDRGQVTGEADLGRGSMLRGGFVNLPTNRHNPYALRLRECRPSAGSLSGIVCAGANRTSPQGGGDSILSSKELEELDLSGVDLIVLSNCETGQGRTAGGEGLLGLQRSLHLGGARTTVASLWKIDDARTQAFVHRFYGNLLSRKMGKLESLIDAQKWMMTEGAKLGVNRGEKSDPRTGTDATNAGPYSWAGFVLSGDWR